MIRFWNHNYKRERMLSVSRANGSGGQDGTESTGTARCV